MAYISRLPVRSLATQSPLVSLCGAKFGGRQRLFSTLQPYRFQYKPLRGSEIRLLRLDHGTSPVDSIELHLEHFSLESVPTFLALSYVWGDRSALRPLSINHEVFQVTKNLHDALRHIRDLLPTFSVGLAKNSSRRNGDDNSLYIWIDAICIDQNNIDEKSRQVPRMTDIYSSAYTVLIWFETQTNSDQRKHEIQFLLRLLDISCPLVDFRRPAIPQEQWTTKQGNEVAKHIIRTYFDILSDEWFSRIWVIQEAALSRRPPCALLGHSLFSFRALYAVSPFVQLLLNGRRSDVSDTDSSPREEPMQQLSRAAIGPTFMRDWIASDEYKSKPAAEQLLWMLADLGSRKCTVPHDRIYGLLGMVDLGQLPSNLLPDYRLPYDFVCKQYTQYLIEQTKDLRLLTPSSPFAFDGQPSWTMDFRYISPPRQVPSTRSVARFDGDRLVVDGVGAEQVVAYFGGEGDLSGERLRRFYERTLIEAAKLTERSLVDVWQDWFASFLVEVCNQSSHHAQSVSNPSELIHFDAADGPGGDLDRTWILSCFSECEFALLHNGQVVQCSRKQPEAPRQHYVYALKGSMQRSILALEEDGAFRFVGRLVEPQLVLDSHFFTTRCVETINIK